MTMSVKLLVGIPFWDAKGLMGNSILRGVKFTSLTGLLIFFSLDGANYAPWVIFR